MKTILSMFLLVALLLSAVSCVHVDDGYERPTKAPTNSFSETSVEKPTNTPTESFSTDAPDPPVIPTRPLWTTPDQTAETFLRAEGIVDCSKREYSYEEMREDLEILAAAYPSVFFYHSFGKSVLGRDLYVAVLGNPNAKKQILVSAGIHGREYLTPLLAMKEIEFCLAYYKSGACNGISYEQLFTDTCFYIVPMTNPDGIMMAQAGISTVTDPNVYTNAILTHSADFRDGYTQQTTINEYLKIWKANANGVDLNRNFDARWGSYQNITRPSHKNFKGEQAASEPETQAMVALTQSLSNIQAVLCIHSQGEVLYWNCGQSSDLKNRTLSFTRMISETNGYEIDYNQHNDASFSDWCALKKGLIAVTVETGVDACPLPISQFPTIWAQNFSLYVRSAAYFS